jgi:hypothetical protein
MAKDKFTVTRSSNKWFERGTPMEVIDTCQKLMNERISTMVDLETVVLVIEKMHGKVVLGEKTYLEMGANNFPSVRFEAEDGAYGLIHPPIEEWPDIKPRKK